MEKSNLTQYIKATLIALLGLLIIFTVLLSLTPPVARDELVHHLAVPRLYIEHGGIYEIPFMEWSYYPMNLDLLYMIPLYFGNDIVPKFIHFTFALLTAWLIYYYLKSRTSKIYALFGILFFLSVPIIIKLSTTAYIDLGEIFFSFFALILILEWIKKEFRIKFLIWSGVMCGLALGTKYNGLVAFAILTFFVPFIYSRYQGKKATGFVRPASYGMIFMLVSILVFSPWMVRNFHWTGNPIYPLYNQLLSPSEGIAQDDTDDTTQDDMKYKDIGIFTYRSIVYKETGLEIALLPVRIFFQGKDDEPQYFDGRLNPFLLILTIFAFYRIKDDTEHLKREKKILLAFSILFFSFAFFSSGLRIRYISPIIPPLTLLSVFGLINLFRMAGQISSNFIRKAINLIVILMPCCALFLNAEYVTGLIKSVDPIQYITGKVSRDEYIAKYIPEYPSLQYINNNLDAGIKILFIYTGKRSYYCDRDYLLDENMGMLKRSISVAEKPNDISTALKNDGITHLLVNYRLFGEWVSNNFTTEKQELTLAFLRQHLELLHSENGFGVLAIK